MRIFSAKVSREAVGGQRSEVGAGDARYLPKPVYCPIAGVPGEQGFCQPRYCLVGWALAACPEVVHR